MKEQQITFPLKIDKNSWDVFKDLTPRTRKLNEVLCGLVYQYITDYSEPEDIGSKEHKEWEKRINLQKQTNFAYAIQDGTGRKKWKNH